MYCRAALLDLSLHGFVSVVVVVVVVVVFKSEYSVIMQEVKPWYTYFVFLELFFSERKLLYGMDAVSRCD